jgi:hypothetical protein
VRLSGPPATSRRESSTELFAPLGSAAGSALLVALGLARPDFFLFDQMCEHAVGASAGKSVGALLAGSLLLLLRIRRQLDALGISLGFLRSHVTVILGQTGLSGIPCCNAH